MSSRARFFALSLFLGLGVSPARSARANSATHAARNVTVTATQTTTIVIAGLSLMTVGPTRRGVTTESDAARATRARATRDARRATNGDRIEARARGLTFLGDDGDDDDARDARLRRRRRRSTATIVSALDVEVDDDGRGARAVERARRWVPMAQVRAKEHQGIVVSAVVLPVHGARVSGEEEDGIATRE